MKQIVKVYADERIDVPDFKAVAGEIELYEECRRGSVLWLPEGRGDGAASTPTDTRILRGFDIYDRVDASGTCKLRNGAGFFKILEEGILNHGVLVGETGSDYATLDLSGEGDDTYSVYVRVTYSDASQQNRVHWNVGGSPAEYVDFVATRRALTWESVYQSSSVSPPEGGDWVEVAQITILSGDIDSVADRRHLFFEGDTISGAGQYASEWGDSADRDNDRADPDTTVGDLHRWAAAVRQKWDDIQGSYYEWWEQTDVNLSDLERNHWGYAKGAHRGKHKAIEFGDTNKWWRLNTGALTGGAGAPYTGDRLSFQAKESPITGQMVAYLDIRDAGSVDLRPFPRGTAALVAYDEFTIKPGYGTGTGNYEDFVSYWKYSTADKWSVGHKFPGTSEIEMELRAGEDWTDAERGLWIPPIGTSDSAGYYVGEREVLMVVPLNMFQAETGSTGWYLYGPSDADVVSEEIYLQSGGFDECCFAQIFDFPNRCTLEYVDVWWWQNGNATGQNMRMYVGRYTYGIVQGEFSTSQTNIQSLNGTADYIEYTQTGNDFRLDRFTCNQNKTNLARRCEAITIGFESAADTYIGRVFAVFLTFKYTQVTPFPHV
jgi:hypothetical protein